MGTSIDSKRSEAAGSQEGHLPWYNEGSCRYCPEVIDDIPPVEGRHRRKVADAQQQAAVVSSSVAEAGDGVCTVDFKLQLSGSRYVLAVACMAGVEVFVLTVPMYVAFVWHSGNGASGGVQTAAAKQRISGTWCVLVVACMASVEVFALTVLMSMACV
ncbi:hypothetical protein PR003_g17475 [Phytophthora rubi]|uniref:Uncharacterized protein n=1 Tax=Phytophthora rubi TaxID=129364 RepID=A0A6A4E804_9STRA|nr:hypothetical protein PR003_g17475 [Phytophthora rubi]